MNWTISRKLGSLCALMLAVLVVLGVTSYRNILSMQKNAEMVAHTLTVSDVLGDIPAGIYAAESAMRGYILTGEAIYINQHLEAVKHTNRQMTELSKIIHNEKARKLFETLETLVQQREQAFTEVRTAYGTKKMAGAIAFIRGGKPIRMTDEIVKVHQQIDDIERELLNASNKELAASNRRAINIVVLGVPFAAILILLVSILLIRSITLPLRQLTIVAERISVGDLSQRPTFSGRNDEVGLLSQAFTRMNDYLKTMSQVAHSLAAQDLTVTCTPKSEQDSLGTAFAAMIANLRGVAMEIQEAARLMSGSTSQIVALTAQLAASSSETAAAVNETTTTIEEIKVTAQLVNQKSAAVSESARDTADITAAGRKSVNDTVQGMTKIRQQMDFIAESIVKLSEQSMAIGEIISSVNDLAGQSNLLAVNASIEAAKAGEHGKGFAVVAQEVRSLAEQSKMATEQVRRILNDIQKAISSAVMATEQGGKTVENSARQTADTETSIQAIEHGAAVTAQASAQILASTNEQVAGLNQVAVAMDNVRSASDQIVISIRQADESVSTLDDLGKKLWRLVERLKVT